MQAAEDGVLEERPRDLKKLHVATASVDVKTGALIGFYGGQDYLKSQLNWARLGWLTRLLVQAVRAGSRAQGRVRAQGHLRRQRAVRAARRRRGGRQPG